MRPFKPSLLLAAVLFAASIFVTATISSSPAFADAPGTCVSGLTSYTTGLTLAVNGVSQPFVSAGVYGTNPASDFVVTSCLDTSNQAYNLSVANINTTTTPATVTNLTSGQLTSTFTFTFTPQVTDTPLEAEGHGVITSFAVNSAAANAVTISAQPTSYADILGCSNPPNQCVIDHPVANGINPANLAISVRYGSSLSQLPGLTISTSGYYWQVSPSCGGGSSAVRVALGGPHFNPDGVTPNVGSLSAYIPAAALLSCFNQTPAAFASSVSVTRTENGTTTAAGTTANADTGLTFTVSSTTSGVTIAVPSVTFSQPTYAIGSSAGSGSSSKSKGGSTGHGYWMTAADGGVFSYGDASFYGSAGSIKLNQPVVSMTPTPDSGGYWCVAADGGVFAFGDAKFFGSAGASKLSAPVVGMVATPSGKGYWLVGRDGSVYPYGDAPSLGSLAGNHLNQPIVGIARTPSGNGYWLVAADGGVFAFGDAPFLGSGGATHLKQPIVAMAASPSGRGYWFVASDGGVFAYGDAGFYGSAGSMKINQPVVGMAASPDGLGYWLVARDGGVFSYGDAHFFGSIADTKLNQPILGMASS